MQKFVSSFNTYKDNPTDTALNNIVTPKEIAYQQDIYYNFIM